MDTLALTDRDGTYGAVKFAKACLRRRHPPGARGRPGPPAGAAGGATAGARRPRSPVRGGAFREPTRLPRVTLLATPGRGGRLGGDLPAGLGDPPGRRAGPAGGRPRPCSPPYLQAGDVVVLLGPRLRGRGGGHPAPRRPGRAALAPLARRSCPPENLLVELVSHRLPGAPAGDWGPGTSPHAARMLGIARAGRAGRGAHQRRALRRPPRRPDRRRARRRPSAGPARPAGLRHVGPPAPGNAEGFLKSGKQMHEVAEEICRLAGLGEPARRRGGCSPGPGPWPTGAPSTRAPTSGSARSTSRSSRPALRRPGPASGGRRRAAGAVRGGDRATATAPAPRQRDLEAARRRAGDDPRPGLRVLLPHRRRRHRPDPRRWGSAARRAGRGPAAWSTTCSASPGSTRSGTAC